MVAVVAVVAASSSASSFVDNLNVLLIVDFYIHPSNLHPDECRRCLVLVATSCLSHSGTCS